MNRRAVIFDVNETVLDLGALDPLFAEWFADTRSRAEWFALTIHFALTLAATRAFRSFGDVGAAALEEIATRRNRVLPQDAAAQLRAAVLSLPPHADVVPSFELLRDA